MAGKGKSRTPAFEAAVAPAAHGGGRTVFEPAGPNGAHTALTHDRKDCDTKG